MKKGFIVLLVLLMSFGMLFANGEGEQAPEAAGDTGAAAAATTAAPAAAVPAKAEWTIRISLNAPERLNTEVVQWEQEYGMADIFKHIVEARTGGRVAVEIYANSQLGDHKSSTEMVQSGGLEATIGTGVMGQFFPAFDVLSIPYLFKSEEIAWDFLDNSQFFKDMKAEIEKETGMTIIAMGQNGVRHFTHSKKQIKTPADLKGERIRVMTSPVFVEMMKAFGADAVPIAWTELYTSLQTGVVDGEENPISVIAGNGIYEVQNYISLDGHLWSEDYFILNSAFLHALPADIQQIIHAAARQAEVVNRAVETIHSQSTGLTKLAEMGMEIYVPSVAEKQMFADIAQPAVLKYLKTKIDPKYVDGIIAAVKESEARCGY